MKCAVHGWLRKTNPMATASKSVTFFSIMDFYFENEAGKSDLGQLLQVVRCVLIRIVVYTLVRFVESKHEHVKIDPAGRVDLLRPG